MVVSVNNYLYLSSVHHGVSRRGLGSVETLVGRTLPLGLNVPLTQVVQLSDVAGPREARSPLKPVVERTLTEFLDTSRAQDRVMVVFVGHAIELDDGVFLAPIEGEPGRPETLLPLKWVYERLAACKARQKVLVLDVCRFNPTDGLERPGSGPLDPPEGDAVGAMGTRLDAMLREPPVGVQVWSACVRGQHSIELENAQLNNGAFVQAIQDALARGSDENPDDLIPVERMAERVNARMKEILSPLNLKQTSRVAGSAPEKGAARDPSEKAPPALSLESPEPPGGVANRKLVADILSRTEMQPVWASKSDDLRPESLPPFSAKVMAEYERADEPTPFRAAVTKARRAWENLAANRAAGLRRTIRIPDDLEALNRTIRAYQENELATFMARLLESLQDLRDAGAERDAEANKRWRADYDYTLARLEQTVALWFEYQSQLSSLRKSLPDYDPKVHNGWRLASIVKLQGDREGQKLAADARKRLKRMTEDYAGTPWEVLARRRLVTALGLDWQATRLD